MSILPFIRRPERNQPRRTVDQRTKDVKGKSMLGFLKNNPALAQVIALREVGHDCWIPEDVNCDGEINVLDVIVVGQHWGEGCLLPTPTPTSTPLAQLQVHYTD